MTESGIEQGGSAKDQRRRRKTAVGIVVSDKCQKTITVAVTRTIKHPLYGKYLRRTTQCLAHDAEGAAHLGDRVEIMETRPISKQKHWRLVRVLERAAGSALDVEEVARLAAVDLGQPLADAAPPRGVAAGRR